MSDATRPYAVRPVRIAVQIQPQHSDYPDIRRAVAAAEDAGVDVAFNWDHFFPLYGDADGKHFEAWTMLGAWAEQTERIEIGSLVTCNSYRNPDLLADMARTLDHVSRGRLVLGIGAGWFEKDYTSFGYDFGTAGSRLAALGAALPRIEARLAAGNPAPTRKVPVLIGGGGERKTLRLVARHADVWHGFGDVDTIAHKHAVLDEWCATEGRDPGEIERSTEVSDGTPGDLGEAFYAIGTRLFTVALNGPDYDMGPVHEWLAWRDDKNRSR
jgi:probable F420-dependent oxidoreductase